jgi:hypothetical protein
VVVDHQKSAFHLLRAVEKGDWAAPQFIEGWEIPLPTKIEIERQLKASGIPIAEVDGVIEEDTKKRLHNRLRHIEEPLKREPQAMKTSLPKRIPLACTDYKAAAEKSGKFYAVASNANTALGYYWMVHDPKIRYYGFYGLIGTGGAPSCASDSDIGKTAESAAFKAAGMWDVREFYCRGDAPFEEKTKCSIPDSKGATFGESDHLSGIFKVTCQEQ